MLFDSFIQPQHAYRTFAARSVSTARAERPGRKTLTRRPDHPRMHVRRSEAPAQANALHRIGCGSERCSNIIGDRVGRIRGSILLRGQIRESQATEILVTDPANREFRNPATSCGRTSTSNVSGSLRRSLISTPAHFQGDLAKFSRDRANPDANDSGQSRNTRRPCRLPGQSPHCRTTCRNTLRK